MESPPPHSKSAWLQFGTPIIVVLAIAVIFTITTNWNAWRGGHVERVTNDAYVRGDLTPLSTKVAGLVKEVSVNDYQAVHKGDVLVQLDDDDYTAQVAQAAAGVEAARAVLENHRRQRELQDAKIERASAGIDQAGAQINAAQAGKEPVQADVTRTISASGTRSCLASACSCFASATKMVAVFQELLAARKEEQRVSTQGLAEGTFLRSQAEAATAQEFEAQTMLLQSQLEYAVAQQELTDAIGQTPR